MSRDLKVQREKIKLNKIKELENITLLKEILLVKLPKFNYFSFQNFKTIL